MCCQNYNLLSRHSDTAGVGPVAPAPVQTGQCSACCEWSAHGVSICCQRAAPMSLRWLSRVQPSCSLIRERGLRKARS